MTAPPAGPADGAPGAPDDLLEPLAVAYHELYREHAGPDDPVARLGWDELPEHLRESNRSTARALRHELTSLGYEVRAAESQAGGPVESQAVAVLPPDLVEQLARAEHARWVRDKLADGYVAGAVRDHEGSPRTHPDLVDWAQLSPAAKDKDRVRFRAAPRLLADLGYEIVRRRT